ncbi:hypothetical protein [Mycolicibacterium vanbaalenii]|uniref:Uncharacterized protein n=1 Tax=Mycolicibacterium vanbaalenii (strain DSM 7251 / JCM 13017 / BCRC 16820 / KCTC 9966 / NRRL B-24157 / PYR-1) TaxID=350058 RepID=A1T825_MYCVP|nr:hypothetical protein [Mycolicibacterium vanbaalenii]ABM13325.1 hypothetical protein Mvan_2514 [Mycolicibacterium vanbaalenii PYR-1]MCV7126832.1 hypothetical protein [Mycolicibacterium vanbaalenii PYR-1]
MTDHDATALVVDAAQLVAECDPGAALRLVGATDIHHRDLQHAALRVLAHVMGGDGAPERFAELRAQVHELALQHGPDDRQVVLNLEVIATSEALAEGDVDHANEIVSGSMFSPIDFVWCAVCITGQVVRGWVGEDNLTEFWTGQRRHWGIGGAA